MKINYFLISNENETPFSVFLAMHTKSYCDNVAGRYKVHRPKLPCERLQDLSTL